MLARYHIARGQRAPDDPLPAGRRQDTRKHTRHVLRPTAAIVERFLKAPDARGFKEFRAAYIALLRQRFDTERKAFDTLAELARNEHVYLGCNCPTARQPDIGHCHTSLALEFMKERYPDLDVRLERTRS